MILLKHYCKERRKKKKTGSEHEHVETADKETKTSAVWTMANGHSYIFLHLVRAMALHLNGWLSQWHVA